MLVNELMKERGITKYRLSKMSGVPQTTVNDLCSGKAKITNCASATLYKIAKAFGVTMEFLIESCDEMRPGFEWFKSQTCHLVKSAGDLDFIINTLKSGEIDDLWEKRWYAESLYLLAMVDYLSRENELPLCDKYNKLRRTKLQTVIYPAGILAMCAAFQSDKPKEDSLRECIPEFLRHNIVESEIRNVA